MEPIYIDLHIHTSVNPNKLNDNYDIDLLITKIKEVSGCSDFLISLTDHNTINKSAYINAKNKVKNLLLGTELHIRNYKDANPYHCHIYFNIENITGEVIDKVNKKLDKLYPDKIITKDNTDIPSLETVIKTFDSYEFVFLPHGGQSHSTFDKSIPDGVQFDNTIERSIYYNQFDGFTARSDIGLEKTVEYFKKLGINEFVNLVTCSDNYNPAHYPETNSKEASPFIPTWMFALPTFEGLRLSLSESSRLVYNKEKPVSWSEYILKVSLKNDNINIDVDLTPGLNVVIGGSSSGKTLFVDSLYNKIINDFSESVYTKTDYNVNEIVVQNPSGTQPHYISQSYIMKVVDNKDSDNSIDDIGIIKNVFPGDDSIRVKVEQGLLEFRTDLKELTNSVKIIEDNEEKLNRIPKLDRLITSGYIQENILSGFMPSQDDMGKIDYNAVEYKYHIDTLDEINNFLEKNPLVEHESQLIVDLKKELDIAYNSSRYENAVRNIINSEKKKVDDNLKFENRELQTKKQDFEKLISLVTSYSKALVKFYETLKKISEYSIECESEEVVSMGHTLFIENKFELNKAKFLDIVNHFLKKGLTIGNFDDLRPQNLFKSNFKGQSPKVHGYDDFENKINSKFEELNNKKYKIITNNGRDFENLSAGWKTSVILDLILGYEEDMVPLIIDQPEDNLATQYINKGLINAIKQIKSKKQIILVSHNATIPMLGDAQNIILCKNDENKITIKSNRLEGKIANKSIIDHIAEITDGGKSSIKKRVKKYNLKKFRE